MFSVVPIRLNFLLFQFVCFYVLKNEMGTCTLFKVDWFGYHLMNFIDLLHANL